MNFIMLLLLFGAAVAYPQSTSKYVGGVSQVAIVLQPVAASPQNDRFCEGGAKVRITINSQDKEHAYVDIDTEIEATKLSRDAGAKGAAIFISGKASYENERGGESHEGTFVVNVIRCFGKSTMPHTITKMVRGWKALAFYPEKAACMAPSAC